jgi:DNA-binding MarR family transcriptional regulator
MPMDLNDPDSCTFSLTNQLNRIIMQIYNDRLASHGISAQQFLTLRQVADKGPLTQTTLASAMKLDPSTITRNLRPLLKKGLVVEVPAFDRRKRVLGISNAGLTTLKTSRNDWQAAQEEAARRLGRKSLQELNSLLQQMLSEEPKN